MIYLGITPTHEREIFSAKKNPTEETHGDKYLLCIGPFRTKRGATFMQRYGFNNPHCQTVEEAEKLGRKYL